MEKAYRFSHGAYGRLSLLTITQPCVEHVHPQAHLIIKCEGEDILYQIGGEPVLLRDEMPILINPWQRHASNLSPARKALVLIAGLEMPWLQCVLSEVTGHRAQFAFRKLTADLSGAAGYHVDAILTGMCGLGRSGEDRLQTGLIRLVTELLDQGCIVNETSVLANSGAEFLDRRIRVALRTVAKQSVPEWSVSSLAATAGMSRSRFFALFREATGISPLQYKDYLRVEAAIRLLTTTDESLGHVASQMGFSAQSHFSRFMKQHLGVPPALLRRYSDGSPGAAQDRLP